jgi:predicted amidohydrolase YtcJ
VTPRAELIVRNGRIGSGSPGADALAIAGGRILAVGRTAEITSLAGPETRVLDAGGGTITPGFTDAHIHVRAWARSVGEIDLTGCTSRDQVLERVQRFMSAHPGDGAVVGRGWEDHGWRERPDRGALDPITGDRVVLLHSKDFHNLWVNSAALRRGGVGRDTPDPPGGTIGRDASGEPNGLLHEHAVRLCARLDSAAAESDDALLDRAIARLHANGVTAVHVFEGEESRRLLERRAGGGRPRVRVLMHVAHTELEAALSEGLASGTGDTWFRTGSLKLFVDGTLGSRTAALLAPYDGTTDTGRELIAPPELAGIVRRAMESGLAVAFHAIGDRAVRSALDAVEAAADAAPRVTLPPRIEHVQLLDPADLPRFARLGVAASMQPSHCVSDIELAERGWGSRREWTYPWRSLLESGARLAFGSDAPVEPPDPVLGLAAALTRSRPGGVAHAPGQRIGWDAALAAYTEGPARLAGWWPMVGRLAEGACADLVIWSHDLHRLPPERAREVAPLWTVLEGEVVFQRSEAGAERRVQSDRAAGATLGR